MIIISTYTKQGHITHITPLTSGQHDFSGLCDLSENQYTYNFDVSSSRELENIKAELTLAPAKLFLHPFLTNDRCTDYNEVNLSTNQLNLPHDELIKAVADELLYNIGTMYTDKYTNTYNPFNEPCESGTLVLTDENGKHYIFLITRGRALYAKPGSIIAIAGAQRIHQIRNCLMEDNSERKYHESDNVDVLNRIKKIVK